MRVGVCCSDAGYDGVDLEARGQKYVLCGNGGTYMLQKCFLGYGESEEAMANWAFYGAAEKTVDFEAEESFAGYPKKAESYTKEASGNE